MQRNKACAQFGITGRPPYTEKQFPYTSRHTSFLWRTRQSAALRGLYPDTKYQLIYLQAHLAVTACFLQIQAVYSGEYVQTLRHLSVEAVNKVSTLETLGVE